MDVHVDQSRRQGQPRPADHPKLLLRIRPLPGLAAVRSLFAIHLDPLLYHGDLSFSHQHVGDPLRARLGVHCLTSLNQNHFPSPFCSCLSNAFPHLGQNANSFSWSTNWYPQWGQDRMRKSSPYRDFSSLADSPWPPSA